jgi:DNA-binding SARP family transcriptional activator
MPLRLRTLGEVEIQVDAGIDRPDLHYEKHTALLVYLACSPRGRTRDHLGELLWPRGKAGRSLNQALVPLRLALPGNALVSDGAVIRLERGSVLLDVDDLARLAGSRRWAEAAELVAGDFCEGLAVPDAPGFEQWLTGERSRWQQLSVMVLASHARARLDAGDLPGALDASHRATDLDPVSETALSVAIRAMALAGQRGAALETYQRFRARLRDELEAEPSPETRALAQRLKQQHFEQPAHAGAATSRRSPLAGRERALAALLEVWQRCQQDRRASIATIEAEPGLGKSRLAEELLERARLDGAVIAQIRLVEADRDRPDGTLAGLVRGGLLEAPGLAAADPACLATIRQVVPEWRGRDPAAAGALPPLETALSEAIRAVVEEHPVVLFLDDAHWGDEASLRALGAVLRDRAATPLLLLLTVERAPGRIEVDRLRSRVGRDHAGAAVRLAALTLEEISSLVEWALPGLEAEQRDRLTRRVLADCAGLPLLVLELLHAVALGLELGGAERSWPAPFQTLTDTLPADLPDAVVMAIRVGFRRLAPAGQKLLAAASVLGDKVNRATLARASGLDGEQVDQALEVLEWQRWLSADGRGYTFLARIVREVVQRDMVSHGQRVRFLERASTA